MKTLVRFAGTVVIGLVVYGCFYLPYKKVVDCEKEGGRFYISICVK